MAEIIGPPRHEMGNRPVMVDLYCKAGGAAWGYHRAGWRVVGVDIEPQPNYPFEFHRADALTFPLGGFDAVHASPPCQRYSTMTRRNGRDPRGHADLIAATRDRLRGLGVPYVIENVMGAPLVDPFRLCGSSFGLGVRRHRLFESNVDVGSVPACRHVDQEPRYRVYDHGKWYLSPVAHVFGNGGGKAKETWSEAMDIWWMTREELTQAVPPAFTEWIGRRLLDALQ